MSDSKKNSISTKIAKLDTLVGWFSSEDFDLDEALEKFNQADALAKEIEEELTRIKNEITVLSQRFDTKE